MAINESGSDVDADVCWDLTEEEQELLTRDQKDDYCNCMGVSVVDIDSCNFPGLGQYYVSAIDEPDPVEPQPIREEPGQLVLPPKPQSPADQSDPQVLQQYMTDLTAYNDSVAILQQEYEAEVASYRVERDLHEVQLAAYRSELGELEIERAGSVSSAEARIRLLITDFGWSFVNKDNNQLYMTTLATTWVAQVFLISILLVATTLVQKRRDLA